MRTEKDLGEVRHPLFWATSPSSDDGFTFFENCEDGSVFVFDYLPQNYPVFTQTRFGNVALAFNRANQMVTEEGWTINEQRFERDYGFKFGHPQPTPDTESEDDKDARELASAPCSEPCDALKDALKRARGKR